MNSAVTAPAALSFTSEVFATVSAI
jgi:hypothetical protein